MGALEIKFLQGRVKKRNTILIDLLNLECVRPVAAKRVVDALLDLHEARIKLLEARMNLMDGHAATHSEGFKI